MRKIILASNSPRRKELLEMARIPFVVQTKNVEENHPEGIDQRNIPVHLAKRKAYSLRAEISANDVVIGADTIVILNNRIFEKPTDRNSAIQMLSALSGNTHEVVTGVCVMSLDKEITFSKTTEVSFNSLSLSEIEFYVDAYKPFDKAGSYACQEWIGAVAISRFNGDYFNVVGLPVNEVYKVLKEDFDFNVLA